MAAAGIAEEHGALEAEVGGGVGQIGDIREREARLLFEHLRRVAFHQGLCAGIRAVALHVVPGPAAEAIDGEARIHVDARFVSHLCIHEPVPAVVLVAELRSGLHVQFSLDEVRPQRALDAVTVGAVTFVETQAAPYFHHAHITGHADGIQFQVVVAPVVHGLGVQLA